MGYLAFLTDLVITIFNFVWKNKTILYNKGTSGGIIIPDIKLYYRGTIMKTSWYWHKNREFDQWNQIKDPDINQHTYEHPIFDKEAKIIQLEKKHLQ